MDMGLRSEWATGQALKKPYPGAPILPSQMGSMGFNAGSKSQESQAKIPQFFNLLDRMLVRQVLYMM